VSRKVNTPFQGKFVIHRLELAIINLYAKYKASMSTPYKDMKGNAKRRNLGGLGG